MIKFGVIGSGWIAEEFVKGAALVDGMVFSAMYSRTYDKGKAFADKFGGAEIYTDIEEFAKSDIDAVYIASPNSLHYSQSKLMLLNNKHVLCEKPITVNPENLRELYALSESRNLIYTEAIMMLHLPQRKLMKDAVKKLGKISSAHFDFSQLSSKYEALKRGENPNIFNPLMQTGCLRDLGIYCFYPAVDMFGIPEKIISSAGFVETGADGWGTAVLQYPEMQITLTYSKTGQDVNGSEILGDKASLHIDSVSKLTGMKIVYPDGKTEEVFGETQKHILMSYEAENFKNYIENQTLFSEEYKRKNKIILDVNQLVFEVKNQCGIL